MVDIATRTLNNIYILDNVQNEKCLFGMIDECWLWHRRMGHVHFKNIIKLIKEHVLRNMLKLTKPFNSN